MKKILYLITQSEMGGAQKYVIELASAMQKNDNYKCFVASQDNEVFKNELSKNNVKFITLNSSKRDIDLFSDINLFFEIYSLTKKIKPDILHLNSSKMGILGALAGKLAGVDKIIFTAHGWVFNENLPSWKRKIFIKISWFSALFQDSIICVSNFDKKMALRHKITKKEKLIVINNGIKIKQQEKILTKNKAKKNLNLHTKKIIIGSVANLYKTKGVKYLIESAFEVLKQHKNILFIVFGDGPERASLEKQIKNLHIEKKFILPGSLPEAYKYLKIFDIFILPSEKEGFPFVLLEAGLAKIPTITTNVGGVSDIINDKTGVPIISKSPTQIENAILNLLTTKDKQKILSENLEKSIKKNFTLEKMIEKTEKLYH